MLFRSQSAYTLKISSIKDINGSEVKAFSQQFTVNDFSAPVVEKVTVVGNKKLVVTFSEPVTPATAQILSNYKINDLLFGASVAVDGREVTLILSNRLADGVHKLSVNSNVVDFANFKLVANNTEFAVAKDETKAALASLDSATQTKVVITLSKPVEGGFTVSSTAGEFVGPATSDDNQTWTLNFLKSNPLPLSGTEIKLTNVTDYYGNKGDITFNVVPTLDLTRPEVVSVTPKSQNTMEVVFSKAVMVPATSAFTVKTVATTPVAVPVTEVAYAKVDGKDVTTKLILTGSFAAKDYTVEIKGVVDTTVQANVMIPYVGRSEERRVGEECRNRGSPYH